MNKYLKINVSLILATLIFSQEQKLTSPTKHKISIGWLDDRNGYSVLGYSNNFMETANNEYFIGVGTIIKAISTTIGWQHYYLKSKLSFSSTLCAQTGISLDGTNLMIVPTAALLLEYKLTKESKVKWGYFGGINLASDPSGKQSKAGILPFLSFSFQF